MNTRKLTRWIGAALLGVCLSLVATAQSISYFMDVTAASGNKIPGTSVASGYENLIEVSSYSLSAANEVTVGGVGGPSAGVFEFQGIECVMALDGKAYPLLLVRHASALPFSEIVLSGVSFGSGGENPRVFFKLEMKNVFIQSISQQGTNGDQPIVNIMFRPSSIRITTTYIKPNGDPSDPVVFERNLINNTNTY
jgi:type VI protein secretion system component Hcp